jgi:P27 family predicted phage terminase small subunit
MYRGAVFFLHTRIDKCHLKPHETMPVGRKPVPTAIKKLNGNPGRRPLNKDEPEIAVSLIVPKAPDHLDCIATEEWTRMATHLHGASVITEVDLKTLEAYATAYSRWRQAEEIIKEDGLLYTTATGTIIQHPAVGIANTSMKEMVRYAVELGATPSSRSRVTVSKPKDNSNPFLSNN